jgi:hypothetical protein
MGSGGPSDTNPCLLIAPKPQLRQGADTHQVPPNGIPSRWLPRDRSHCCRRHRPRRWLARGGDRLGTGRPSPADGCRARHRGRWGALVDAPPPRPPTGGTDHRRLAAVRRRPRPARLARRVRGGRPLGLVCPARPAPGTDRAARHRRGTGHRVRPRRTPRSRPGGADPHRADRAVLRVVESDPLAEPLPWPSLPHQQQPRSVTAPIELGVFDDGSPVLLRLLHRNALVGGVVGAGKSGVLNVVLAYHVACRDVVIWGDRPERRHGAAALGRLPGPARHHPGARRGADVTRGSRPAAAGSGYRRVSRPR